MRTVEELIEEIIKLNDEIVALMKKLNSYKYIDTSFLKHEIDNLKRTHNHLKRELYEMDTKNRR